MVWDIIRYVDEIRKIRKGDEEKERGPGVHEEREKDLQRVAERLQREREAEEWKRNHGQRSRGILEVIWEESTDILEGFFLGVCNLCLACMAW